MVLELVEVVVREFEKIFFKDGNLIIFVFIKDKFYKRWL